MIKEKETKYCQIDTLLDKDMVQLFKSQKKETEKYNLIKRQNIKTKTAIMI